ncbi:MAG: hypothetical protein EOO06_14265 [Chitinophagaceae bacterium]|nr:MAG: hypothetical protein EOO06_14265 [Chitinophagaceae bacterium]
MKNRWVKLLVWAIGGCAIVFLYLQYSGKLNKTHVVLEQGKTNSVKLKDTLWIAESTCRGCAYENSTSFDVVDDAGLVKLVSIKTTDDASSNTDGGSISKTLVLVPTGLGSTTIKQYKYYGEQMTAKDSASFKSYSIEIKQ